ncbi:MAG: TRAP transporter substrate-binding protein [Betaproteobacteria bacterium]|nr:TRAP transporter substrate-binding protein [Betaproteobacteria bacterium]
MFADVRSDARLTVKYTQCIFDSLPWFRTVFPCWPMPLSACLLGKFSMFQAEELVMKMSSKIAGALLTSALLLSVLAPVHAQIVLKTGHISPKASAEGIVVDRFAALVKEKTNGEVLVEVFPSEQLGPATAMIESTILGNQDLYVGGNVEFERFSPGLKALGLNYAVESQEQFRKILKSPLWKEMFVDPLDKAGLAVVASDWERGPFRVLISTKPVKNFDDLKGLKLRIAPIDTWRKSWTALGTQVVVLPWNDVYLGLQQGMIDAVTAPANLLTAMKFTEVAKYVARTDEYWGVLTLVGNKKKWASLKAEHRRAITEAADQAGKEYMRTADAEIERDFASMKAKGVQYTVLDLKPGAAKMRPVIQDLEKEGFIPAGIYERIRAVK